MNDLVLKIVPIGTKAASYMTFRSDVVTVGRLTSNHLVLPHASVADHHATLRRAPTLLPGGRPSTFLIESRACVEVDHQVAGNSVPIADGQIITIGAYLIEIFDREAPSEIERGFLQGIGDVPKDDAARAVYADWLEEVGRLDEAELIRAQLTVKQLAPQDPRFQDLAQRIRLLGPKTSLSFRRTIAQPPLERCGGFQYELQCPNRWDQLAPTDSPKERFCGSCKRNVHYATTVSEAIDLVERGECLVVDIVPPRTPNDLVRAPVAPPLPGYYLPPPPPPLK